MVPLKGTDLCAYVKGAWLTSRFLGLNQNALWETYRQTEGSSTIWSQHNPTEHHNCTRISSHRKFSRVHQYLSKHVLDDRSVNENAVQFHLPAYQQIPTTPKQKAIIICSIIFGLFVILGILLTLGNLILYFAEKSDKMKEEEGKTESRENLTENGNGVRFRVPELRINGQRLSRDEEAMLEGGGLEGRLQNWRSAGAERL